MELLDRWQLSRDKQFLLGNKHWLDPCRQFSRSRKASYFSKRQSSAD